MRFVSLPELSLDRAGPAHKLAVSTTALFGHPHSQSATAQRLRALTPVARTTTFLIYDLPAGRSDRGERIFLAYRPVEKGADPRGQQILQEK
jgi:hypothetical protein